MTRKLKPFEAPSLPTHDPQFSWLKYQILKYLEDWLKTIELRPGVYEKSETKNVYMITKGIKINVHTAIELAHKVFNYA